jgi:hypothetical protein
MKGGMHSRFNGDFCSGFGKKDLFLLRSGFVYSQGLAGCTRASSHFTLCPAACSDNYSEPSVSVLFFSWVSQDGYTPFSSYAILSDHRLVIGNN